MQSFKVRLDITDQDIADGERQQCHTCPGALAALRALAPLGVKAVTLYQTGSIVGQASTSAYDDAPDVYFPHYSARHSDELIAWIKEFDRGEAVSPAIFMVEYELQAGVNG